MPMSLLLLVCERNIDLLNAELGNNRKKFGEAFLMVYRFTLIYILYQET